MNILVPSVLAVSALSAIALDRKSKRKSRLHYLGFVVLSFAIMYASGFMQIYSFVVLALNIIIMSIGLTCLFLATCHRLRDLGRSRWFFLLFAVPMLNIAFLLYCLFFPSADDEATETD